LPQIVAILEPFVQRAIQLAGRVNQSSRRSHEGSWPHLSLNHCRHLRHLSSASWAPASSCWPVTSRNLYSPAAGPPTAKKQKIPPAALLSPPSLGRHGLENAKNPNF